MLSIIISSYQEHFYTALEKNIAETIGIPYEIIKIDNPNLMGICEAYNIGASQAQFDYLIFIHEDILFHTKDWGQLLINHLEKENTGVVGVAGSNYVPKAPHGWFIFDEKYNFKNYIQNNKEKTNPETKLMKHSFVRVFGLDGVFLAVKKSVYQEFLFDESVIKGFHGYDLDFSLRVATRYHNYVINDVLIEHFSKGNPDKKWFDNNILIREKNKHRYQENFDDKVESILFHDFLRGYFSYYKPNLKNIFFTLKFFPHQLSWRNKLLIFKGYLYYFFKHKYCK